MESLIATRPTWGIGQTGDGPLVVGPLDTFATPPGQTVTVVSPGDVPSGVPTARVRVRENAQEFDVTYHDFPGYRGLYHGRGKNWILWTDDLRRVFVSRGPEEWARSWVYARFLLRHLIVSRLLAEPGYRCLHAVAGPLRGAEDAGLVIAGPYLSGKTFLLRALIERGIVAEEVEDDCAVIDPAWRLHCLIPAEHELRAERTLSLRAMVCLDRRVGRVEPLRPAIAAAWAAAIQTSWPLSWVPGPEPRITAPATAPGSLHCLRCPERPAINDALLRALERLCRDVSR